MTVEQSMTVVSARGPSDSPKALVDDVADELVDRNRRQREALQRAAGPERDRHTGHRLLVRRLEDVAEVVGPEQRVLLEDLDAHGLDLVVDGLDPLRVVL